MRALVAAAIVGGLAVAPLAAEAAQAPIRYSVSLEATVVDRASYEQTARAEDCVTRREGEGTRRAVVRSVRRATISVAPRGAGVVYRPARLAAVRVSGTTGTGSYIETRICRANPIERTTGNCRTARIPPLTVGAAFRRPARGAIRFGRAPAAARGRYSACGLNSSFPSSWLDHVSGTVNEGALRRGARVVRARGARPAVAFFQSPPPSVEVSRRAIVRWTLTFRRIG